MSPHENKDAWYFLLGEFGEIHNLRHVRQVVAPECHGVRRPGSDERQIVFPRFYLQVDQADVMSCLAGGLGYHLESEWFQAKIDFGVHERTGMHCEESHFLNPPLGRCSPASGKHIQGLSAFQSAAMRMWL